MLFKKTSTDFTKNMHEFAVRKPEDKGRDYLSANDEQEQKKHLRITDATKVCGPASIHASITAQSHSR
jgi:phosphopantothenoylcysteine synthetase/decarboxylase